MLVKIDFFLKYLKNILTKSEVNDIISFVDAVREHAGIGRQARLRGVCFVRVGSSPTARTNSNRIPSLVCGYF